MLLNLGCGFNKLESYVNVDSASSYAPDVVLDLESTPWPWPDNAATEIRLDHVLEHLGRDTKTYLAVWKELWRVSAPNARLFITVPHWRHENFAHDPTHVRPITPIGIAMFDQVRNREDAARGGQETKLGLLNDVDFALEKVDYDFVPEIAEAILAGRLSREKVFSLMDHENNVCQQIRMIVRAVKPCRESLPKQSV